MNDFLPASLRLAICEMALSGVTREFPHKLDHVYFAAGDARTPRALHPSFYGCYDWHSAVHSHWVLVQMLNDPALHAKHADIERVLNEHFSAAAIAREHEYLLAPGREGFERPYGWAWLWALVDALDQPAPLMQRWRAELMPLGDLLTQRWLAWLDKQVYPCRQGTHANTAFAMTWALDHALRNAYTQLLAQLRLHAFRLFGQDKQFSVSGEPSANDFLSPVLAEGAMMTRCLGPSEWLGWWTTFMPQAIQNSGMEPANVNDREDAQGVHLDGLNLSRAWHAAEIAHHLAGSEEREDWRLFAQRHWQAGVRHVSTGDFLGEHWLGTFALAAGQKLQACSAD